MNNSVIIYGAAFCPMVLPTINLLIQAGVNFEYINILENPIAREYVQHVNKGYASVPTLVFPDGSILTEPSGSVLRIKLENLGYDVPSLPLWAQMMRRLLSKYGNKMNL